VISDIKADATVISLYYECGPKLDREVAHLKDLLLREMPFLRQLERNGAILGGKIVKAFVILFENVQAHNLGFF
jgi:hypothetical protein